MNSFFLNDNCDTNKLSKTVLEILKEDQKFLFSSRGYWDYYDYLTIIEAFNKINNEEIALVLAGSNGQLYYKKLLIDKIKKSKFNHKIYTLGHLNKDELKILYKNATHIFQLQFTMLVYLHQLQRLWHLVQNVL